jgi:hypothetical protein
MPLQTEAFETDSTPTLAHMLPNYITSGDAVINEMAAQLQVLDAAPDASLRQASTLAANSAKESAVVADNARVILSHANARRDSMIINANSIALEYANRTKLTVNKGLFEDIVISIPLGIIFDH